jgi:hypothetical protein
MAAATVAIHKARQRAAENGEEEETAAEKRKHTRQAMTEPAPRPTTPGKLNIGDLSRGEDIPITVEEDALADLVAKASASAGAAVPLRKLELVWARREDWRGFVLFCLCAGVWAGLQHYRVDAMNAYDTYRVYAIAEAELPKPYNEITSTSGLVTFLDTGVVKTVMSAMAATGPDAICPGCGVGLTAAAGDMFDLTLADFICSDFDSQAGSSEYPMRDCERDDAVWAAQPTVNTAPCCMNNTLALYSLVLMASYAQFGVEALSLGEIAEINENKIVPPPEIRQCDLRASTGYPVDDTSYCTDRQHWTTMRLFKFWVRNQIRDVDVRGGSDEPGSLIQLILSRDGRMAGIGFKANLLDETWFPQVVDTYQQIWSQRYDSEWLEFVITFAILAFLDGLHEFHDIYHDLELLYRISHDAMLFEDVSRFRRVVGVLHAYLFNAQTVFLLLIELPSVLGPMLLEVSRVTGLVSVNDFNLFVSVLLAILLVRFFQEGQVIPALKLLVLTMVQATEQLVNFMIIMIVTLIVASEMHVTVFGVYTKSYETERDAFLYTFDFLANGHDFDANSGEIKNSTFGYIFIYLFSALFLLLVLAQFFIAILVSAWEAASDLKVEQARVHKLPPGFNWAPDTRPWWKKILHLMVFAATGWVPEVGASGSKIKHALRHAVSTLEFKIKKRKAEAENTYAKNAEGLTEEDENEIFLFEHGLVVRKYVKDNFLSSGLSDSAADYLLDMFAPPEALMVDEGVPGGVAKVMQEERQLNSASAVLHAAEDRAYQNTHPDHYHSKMKEAAHERPPAGPVAVAGASAADNDKLDGISDSISQLQSAVELLSQNVAKLSQRRRRSHHPASNVVSNATPDASDGSPYPSGIFQSASSLVTIGSGVDAGDGSLSPRPTEGYNTASTVY